jgi:hypothetical protein
MSELTPRMFVAWVFLFYFVGMFSGWLLASDQLRREMWKELRRLTADKPSDA